MNIVKEIGKITRADFGWGGYQDIQFGISLQFEGPSWATGTFIGAWGRDWTPDCKWTEADRGIKLGVACMALAATLKDAKVKSIQELIGKPVEVTFENGTFKGFRILTEVL